MHTYHGYCLHLLLVGHIGIRTRDRPISLFETDTDIFNYFFSDIWPAADIQLAIYTDIPKFAYGYFCRYFNKIFWFKLVGITYSPD